MLTRLLAVVSAGALATLAVGAPAPAQTDGDEGAPSIPIPRSRCSIPATSRGRRCASR